MRITLEDISEYRKPLMGVATIMVMLVHSDFSELHEIVESLQSIFQVGVEIFLLLSGFSCYYSLNHNKKLKRFYFRRLRRIYLPYLVVEVLYGILQIRVWGTSFHRFYRRNTVGGFFSTGGTGSWFIAAILALYLVTPLLKRILDRNPMAFWIMMATICTVANELEFLTTGTTMKHIIEFLLMRIPFYMIGMYLGKLYAKRPEKTIKVDFFWIILGVALLSANLLLYKGNRIVGLRVICLPFLVPFLVGLIKLVENKGTPFLKFIGGISIEVYLFYEKVTQILGVYCSDLSTGQTTIVSVVITIILSYLLKQLLNREKKPKEKKKKPAVVKAAEPVKAA